MFAFLTQTDAFLSVCPEEQFSAATDVYVIFI